MRNCDLEHCSLDVTWAYHTYELTVAMVTCTRWSLPTFLYGGRVYEGPPSQRSCWQLMVTGGGGVIFFNGVDIRKLPSFNR